MSKEKEQMDTYGFIKNHELVFTLTVSAESHKMLVGIREDLMSAGYKVFKVR